MKTYLSNSPVVIPNGKIPGVAPITPRRGDWSSNNQLGQWQDADRNALRAANGQTILKLDEWGMPELWTITLLTDISMSALQASAGINSQYAFDAYINFGAGGSTQTVRVDWLNGMQLTLPMNAVNVIAKARHQDPFISQRLGVQLARGSRPGNTPVTQAMIYTEEGLNVFTGGAALSASLVRISMPAASTAVITLPYFATEVRFTAASADLYDANFLISTLRTKGGTADVFQQITGANLLQGFSGIPIANGARYLYLQNNTANLIQLVPYAILPF